MFFRKSIAKVLADSDSRRVFLEIAYRSTEKASKQPSKLSDVERMAIRLRWLVAETLNGSLSQYLHNEAGDEFELAALDLERIGVPAARDVLVEVRRMFPGGEVPVSRAQRSELLSALEVEEEPRIADLTRQFRKCVPAIMSHACDFYRANAESIGP